VQPRQLSFNGLDGHHGHRARAAARRPEGLRLRGGLHPGQGVRLAHWLGNGADGGRLLVRCFGGDGIVRENVAGDLLASLTTI
jgi:hypothetical protein